MQIRYSLVLLVYFLANVGIVHAERKGSSAYPTSDWDGYVTLTQITSHTQPDSLHVGVKVVGSLYDSESRETLPTATVQILGTYKGTVSNAEGRFEIYVDSLPAVLSARFLGYQTQTIRIESPKDSLVDIFLRPSIAELPELVITEDDPALSIMERVIARKQVWKQGLYSFKAEAYTRLSLSNDSSVVLISESINEVYWDRDQGYREILKTYEKTSNLDDTIIPIGVNDLPNFYDDNIEILSYNVVGVTHPDALDYYQFKLLDYERIDDQLIYKIDVQPRRQLQPTFEGTIYVLADDYALLEVNLRPGNVITFPPPAQEVSFTYSQQYSNYGKEYWLPVDSRVEGTIKIGLPGLQFPAIHVNQIARVATYDVNTAIPRVILEEEDMVIVDSVSIASTKIGEGGRTRVPLTREEDIAYQELDSTMTLDKAFQPTGFLARMLDDSDEDQDSTTFFGEGPLGKAVDLVAEIYSPVIRFDRVNGPYFGGEASKKFGELEDRGQVEILFDGGYAFHRKAWDRELGIGLSRQFDNSMRVTGEVSVVEKATIRQKLRWMPRSAYSLSFLLGSVDPLDHYLEEGWLSSLQIDRKNVGLSMGFHALQETSLRSTELFTYSLTGSRDQPRRINPAIDEGAIHRLAVGLLVSESGGREVSNIGFAGVNRIQIDIDYSDASIGSDYNFIRAQIEGELSIETFYKRRFLPNTFSLITSAGMSEGRLPYQHLFTIEPSTLSFAPFGLLKTQSMFPYEGDRFWRVYAEHDFKSTPFEALGLWGLSKKGLGLIVFGGAANAWVSDPSYQQEYDFLTPALRQTDGPHVEIGGSINGIFSILRLDAAFRLDTPDTYFTIGVARYF